MEENILINLLDTYKPVTDKDIKIAKNYVALRERTANALSSRIDDILKDAAESITRICYQFNVDPQTFTISSSYNEEMFSQIAEILDELEDEIIDLTLEYATDCTDDNDRLSTLIPWLLSLGRGNKNLRQTLEKRLWIFSRDLEAMIAAMRYAKRKMTDAVTLIKSNLYAVYVTPEIIAAIKSKKPFQATYIKSGGIKKGNAGNSNSEANNIQRFGEITVQMSWMRNLRMDYEENGAAGFIVRRGSNYDCPLCDEHVGFHKIDEIEHFPPFHGHCCCYAIGVYMKDEEMQNKQNNETKSNKEVITEEFKQRRKEISAEAKATLRNKKFSNDDVPWKVTVTGGSIDEWLNQPHDNIAKKNEALLDFEELFSNAKYLGDTIDKPRKGIVCSHIFETKLENDPNWIIIHETEWGEYVLHCMSSQRTKNL